MKKRSSLSGIFLIVIIAAAAYGIYQWYVVPFLQKRALNNALEKGCEAVVNKYEEQKEEIEEDLKNLLEKIEGQNDPEGSEDHAEKEKQACVVIK